MSEECFLTNLENEEKILYERAKLRSSQKSKYFQISRPG